MPPSNCSSNNPPQQKANRGGFFLAAVFALLTAIWLLWLPRLAKDPGLQTRMRQREEQGIDAAAMFYSDLPAVDQAQDRLQKLETEDPDLFWSP
ncbi:hypothetical protein [Rubinisphaera margarita]|uniref:hypothetical protein n=1 Tax=Rubinisphaera margarita TaxID=2909586 RepID=UPI001EE996B2|nr:hypothetical protein [Rubinisphaera margarita]MCG6155994.1 hypothetical protein [Rubinisphaera margarita]